MSEVKMPRQARQQLAAAAALEQNIANAMAAPTGTVPIEVAAATPAAPAEQKTDTAQAPATPAAPAVATPAPPAQDWEQMARTYRGRYEQEILPLERKLQQMQHERDTQAGRLTQLENELRSLREKPAPVMDPKDAESFGADLVAMVQRQASAEIGRAIEQALGTVSTRLDRLEATVNGVSQRSALSAEQQFFAALKQLAPDYEAINTMPGFLAWLGAVDPVYGEPRQVALDRARESLNAERCAAIFSAFKASMASPAAAPPSAPANSLQEQITPARSGATEVPVPAAPVVVSAGSITAFYNDLRRGVYRGREAEAQRIESEINLALAQGRVA